MKICLVGFGRLGSAIGKRLKRFYEMKVSTLPPTDELARKEGLEVVDLKTCINFGDVVIVSVEPSAMDSVLSQMEGLEKPLISTAALYGLKEIRRKVKCGYRTMPSVTVEIGKSPVLVSERGGCNDEAVEEILSKLGKPIWVKEEVLDAALPVVGSGPAIHSLYYNSLVEALVYAGVDRKLAEEMVKESVIGTMEFLKKYDPLEVRARVETPGGITVKMTVELEKEGVFGSLSKIVGETGRELRTRR
ncbi:hypothetical protein EYM_06220 [Ignicoccus islandicus DSM 13165]|uniref:Pyrroline-5-carboxylate reductase n=1 Tax=Ignicoccus islandicus DSM 13165 TaxID=940295 RepID=A0A0U3FAG4_9CREN|nr:pyrroline-5-carboxylate reductase dimerization domain-containing protein [Ignicoccus islandicus]ALU12665.1 hypothetical protein EYM_06220 [Ignicoccus islandicus DSM 13165]